MSSEAREPAAAGCGSPGGGGHRPSPPASRERHLPASSGIPLPHPDPSPLHLLGSALTRYFCSVCGSIASPPRRGRLPRSLPRAAGGKAAFPFLLGFKLDTGTRAGWSFVWGQNLCIYMYMYTLFFSAGLLGSSVIFSPNLLGQTRCAPGSIFTRDTPRVAVTSFPAGNIRCTSRRSWRTDSLCRGARGHRRSPAECCRPRRRLHPLAWQREQQGERVSRAPRSAPLFDAGSWLPWCSAPGTADPGAPGAPSVCPHSLPAPACSPSPPSASSAGQDHGGGNTPAVRRALRKAPNIPPPPPRPEKEPLSATATAGASRAERTQAQACRLSRTHTGTHTRLCARGWAGAKQPPRRRWGGERQPPPPGPGTAPRSSPQSPPGRGRASPVVIFR